MPRPHAFAGDGGRLTAGLKPLPRERAPVTRKAIMPIVISVAHKALERYGRIRSFLVSDMPPMRRPFFRPVIAAGVFGAGLAFAALAETPADPRPEERRTYTQSIGEVRTLMASQQWGRAASKLDALLAQRPREAQARFLKGVVQTEQGQPDAAISTFRALIEDYPEIPEPYNNLAVLYARKGEIENARTALETAVKTAPGWAVAQENLGDIYARIAADHYDRAANLDRVNKSAATKLRMAQALLASTPNAAKP